MRIRDKPRRLTNRPDKAADESRDKQSLHFNGRKYRRPFGLRGNVADTEDKRGKEDSQKVRENVIEAVVRVLHVFVERLVGVVVESVTAEG